MSLIALVTLRLLIDEERVEIQPGDEVPADALNEHDQRELIASGAIEDTDATAAAIKANKKDAAEASAEFAAARQRVTAAAESTTPAKKSAASKKGA